MGTCVMVTVDNYITHSFVRSKKKKKTQDFLWLRPILILGGKNNTYNSISLMRDSLCNEISNNCDKSVWEDQYFTVNK